MLSLCGNCIDCSTILFALSPASLSPVHLLWKSFAVGHSLYCRGVSHTENLPNILQKCDGCVEDGELEVSLEKVFLKIILFKHSSGFCIKIAE